MRILLTNDDGIYAPGLAALYEELKTLGDVEVVAPAVNQSGVAHSITHLQPLIVQQAFRGKAHFGWEVDGSPADCVKLAIQELCRPEPDIVVSGINGGANAGINVLYSGTVAAAIEGAFFGVTSIAVSLTMSAQPDFEKAAKLAVQIIPQILDQDQEKGALWNLNLPESRPEWPIGVKLLPFSLKRHRETLEKRYDPRGRTYFWSGADRLFELPLEPDADVEALAEGYATVTPLHFNLNDFKKIERYQNAEWKVKIPKA